MMLAKFHLDVFVSLIKLARLATLQSWPTSTEWVGSWIMWTRNTLDWV